MPDVVMDHRTREGSIVQTRSLANTLDFFRACREWEGFVRRNVPGLFTWGELDGLLGRRFHQKLAHWRSARGMDRRIAAVLRREILRDAPSASWGRGTVAKWWLLRLYPAALELALEVREGMRGR